MLQRWLYVLLLEVKEWVEHSHKVSVTKDMMLFRVAELFNYFYASLRTVASLYFANQEDTIGSILLFLCLKVLFHNGFII